MSLHRLFSHQVPEASEGAEGVGCLPGTTQDDRRLQRDGPAAGADVGQGADGASLEENPGCDRTCLRCGGREFHAAERAGGTTAPVQGRN